MIKEILKLAKERKDPMYDNLLERARLNNAGKKDIVEGHKNNNNIQIQEGIEKIKTAVTYNSLSIINE